MPYTPTDWKDLPDTSTPIVAAELNRMEAGIDSSVFFADNHPGAIDPHGDRAFTTAAIAAAASGYQPVDSDLTAIATLTTTPYGRAFLTLADAAAARAALSLGTAAQSDSSAFDPAGSAATAQANAIAASDPAGSAASAYSAAVSASQPVDADLSAIAALTTTAYGRAFLGLADAAAARAALSLGDAATKNTGSSAGQVAAGDHTHAGGSLTVQDENSNVSTGVTQIDFQGAGVTTTAGTGEVIVTIPGGGGSSVGVVHTYDSGGPASTFGSLPSDSTGSDGDFIRDIRSGMVFGPKTSGAWPAVPNGLAGTKSGGSSQVYPNLLDYTKYSWNNGMGRAAWPTTGTDGVALAAGYKDTQGFAGASPIWRSAHTGWEIAEAMVAQWGTTYGQQGYVKGGSLSFVLKKLPSGGGILQFGLGMFYSTINPGVTITQTSAYWSDGTAHSSGVAFAGYTPTVGDLFYIHSAWGKYDLQIVRGTTVLVSSVNFYTGDYTLGGTHGFITTCTAGNYAVVNNVVNITVMS